MRYLPTGKQNFKDIRQRDLIYVDKTRQMYELIQNGSLYFLSRPRRFGKSLLLSKFQYLFSGAKDIFKGLYIHEQTDYDFEAYPVLHFNFSKLGKVNIENSLSFLLKEYAMQYDFELPDIGISLQLDALVKHISKRGKPVVLLIDEYDSPITNHLTNLEQARQNREVLKVFFSPIKDLDTQGHLHFLFITGVSKFSKVSLFSDLNNLTDLSLHRWSDDLLGITHDELLHYFSEHINAAAQTLQQTRADLLKNIKIWYKGYAYNPDIKLYNLFSILSFFQAHRFGNFWFATGTPTFLVNMIRDRGVRPTEFVNKTVSDTFFIKFSLAELDLTGLLYQTGYLTITAIKREGTETYFSLNYPNEEVRRSVMHNLMEARLKL